MTKLESEAKKLRDNLYGPCSSKNWEACAEHWVREIAWLRLATTQGAKHANEVERKKLGKLVK